MSTKIATISTYLLVGGLSNPPIASRINSLILLLLSSGESPFSESRMDFDDIVVNSVDLEVVVLNLTSFLSVKETHVQYYKIKLSKVVLRNAYGQQMISS